MYSIKKDKEASAQDHYDFKIPVNFCNTSISIVFLIEITKIFRDTIFFPHFGNHKHFAFSNSMQWMQIRFVHSRQM